ncbi:MAG: site-2 protease family protein [Candidatus Bathyarchaeota archaeon]|nr:MAG: site-2 protease family protein [Candidatus Bathyarchaeota archaeon]
MSNTSVDSTIAAQFEKIHSMVTAEFDVDESLLEHGIPTFYVRLRSDSKHAFTRLVRSLASINFTPLLRKKDGKNVLKVAPKPKIKPSRPIINIILLLATIITVFITGYILSLGFIEYGMNPWIGAASFALTLLGILGAHEMAHKLAADHHEMKATLPYFIPGPPFFGIGTFGAVIVQKETAPNRDALFDIGASGPIAGFIVAILVTAIGLSLSAVELMPDPAPTGLLPSSLLFSFLVESIVSIPGPGRYIILLHPVAFAGWIGMLITLLNLLPTGMLDGGHTLRSIISSDLSRTIFTIVSIIILFSAGQWLMLALVLFLSMYKHPGPLDDISRLSLSRKLISIALVLIFILCMFLPQQIIQEIFRLFGLF